MTKQDEQRWNARYLSGDGPRGRCSVERLEQCARHIDALAARLVLGGQVPRALDVACGAGAGVIWLAKRGWLAQGVDISGEAIRLASAAAHQAGVAQRCDFVQADLDRWRPPVHSAHLVTCLFYLDRRFWQEMGSALHTGGLLLVETYNYHRLIGRPSANPSFLLQAGELERLFQAPGWCMLAGQSETAGHEHPTDWILVEKKGTNDEI